MILEAKRKLETRTFVEARPVAADAGATVGDDDADFGGDEAGSEQDSDNAGPPPMLAMKIAPKPALSRLLKRPTGAFDGKVAHKIHVVTKHELKTTSLKNLGSRVYHAALLAAKHSGKSGDEAKVVARAAYGVASAQWTLLASGKASASLERKAAVKQTKAKPAAKPKASLRGPLIALP